MTKYIYERDFKGVWVSKEIWLDTNLSWMEKLFLVEINSLDKSERGCFASNKYFSEFFDLSKVRCSQIISSLVKKKFVAREYVKSGKQIKKRILRTKRNFLKRGY